MCLAGKPSKYSWIKKKKRQFKVKICLKFVILCECRNVCGVCVFQVKCFRLELQLKIPLTVEFTLPLVLCNLTWVHAGTPSSAWPTSLLHSDHLSPGQLTGGLLVSSAGKSVCSVQEQGWRKHNNIYMCTYFYLCLGELFVCFNYLRGLSTNSFFVLL